MIMKKAIYIDSNRILFITDEDRYFIHTYRNTDEYYNMAKSIIMDKSIRINEYCIIDKTIHVTGFFDKTAKQKSRVFNRKVREIKDITNYLHLIL